jgi:hypothetical protein
VCERGIFGIRHCLHRVPIQSLFTPWHSSSLFHQSRDGPVHQSIGPWAYGRAGPNRKAHLVPLIAITAAMTTGINEWQSFESNRLDHKFVATPYLLGLVSLSVTLHVLVGQITNLGKWIPHVKRPDLCHSSSKPALRTSSAVVNPQFLLLETPHSSFSSHRYNLRLCYEAKCLRRRPSWGIPQLLLSKYTFNQLPSSGFARHGLVSSHRLFHPKALQRVWPASHAPFPLPAIGLQNTGRNLTASATSPLTPEDPNLPS